MIHKIVFVFCQFFSSELYRAQLYDYCKKINCSGAGVIFYNNH